MSEKPPFPIIMFLFAATKDFIFDPIILGLTVVLMPVGWLLGILISIIYSGILWIWLMSKQDGRRAKMMFKGTARIFAAFGISMVPIVRFIIPEMTFVVYMTYRHEVSLWKKERKKKTRTTTQSMNKMQRRRNSARRVLQRAA